MNRQTVHCPSCREEYSVKINCDMEKEVNSSGSLKTMMELKSIKETVKRRRMETLTGSNQVLPNFISLEEDLS